MRFSKYLVATYFQDVFILGHEDRGVDVSKDIDWIGDDKSTDAYNYCKSVTYLRCMPFRNPKPPVKICISYLRARLISNFNILFTKKIRSPQMSFIAVKIDEALAKEFKENSNKFIDDYGHIWHFCKCRKEHKERCMEMIKGKMI